MPVENVIGSPRDLLTSVEQIREALFLTYTSNLAFFERFALQELRSRGALVTVVSDATAAHVDPRDVKSAGRFYLDGRAACRRGGRFHPKLIVLCGEEELVVAIGSGNVTMPGWHQNAELWTVLQGDREGVPTAVRQLVPWLRGLPTEVAFSPGVEQAFGRVAELIGGFPDGGTGPRLITSLSNSIVSQLPSPESTESLVVSAPFFDPDAAALKRLADTFHPATVRIAIQRTEAVFDGPALAEAIEQLGASIDQIADGRYHHGKLVEWQTGEGYQVLTGSPNVSVAALLRPMTEGGNCELALLGAAASSLAPEVGDRLSAEEIREHLYDRDATESTRLPALLAVMLSPEGARVYLAAALDNEGVIEVLEDDRWQAHAVAPAGRTEISLGLIGTGTAVRIRVGDLLTNIVAACDLSSVLRRRISHQGRVRTDPNAMFDDLGIPDQFAKDLEELRPFLPAAAAPPKAPSDLATPDSTPRPPEKAWEEYLEACAAQIGDPMLSFAFGLPQLFGDTDVEVGLADDPGALESDTDEEAAAEEEEKTKTPPVRDFQATATEQQRERIRRFCARLADLSPNLVPIGQLITVRLLLRLIAGKLWGDPTDGAAFWVPLLHRATVAAAQGDAQFDTVAHARGSLTALSLAVLRAQVKSFSPYTFDPYRETYETAEAAALPVLGDATEEQISRYSAELLQDLGQGLQARAVMALVEDAQSLDALDEAIRTAADEMGLEMSRAGRLLTIENELPRPLFRSLLRALRAVENQYPVGIEGETDNEQGAVVWDRPTLIYLREVGGRRTGSLYSMAWPGIFADSDLPRARMEWVGDGGPEEAQRLIGELGLAGR